MRRFEEQPANRWESEVKSSFGPQSCTRGMMSQVSPTCRKRRVCGNVGHRMRNDEKGMIDFLFLFLYFPSM